MGNNSSIASNSKKFPKLVAFWAIIAEYIGGYCSISPIKNLNVFSICSFIALDPDIHAFFRAGADGNVVGAFSFAQIVEDRVKDIVEVVGVVVLLVGGVVTIVEPFLNSLPAAFEAFFKISALTFLDAKADNAEDAEQPYGEEGPAHPFVLAFTVGGAHA